jgi:hypothetical protein
LHRRLYVVAIGIAFSTLEYSDIDHAGPARAGVLVSRSAPQP